MFTKILVTFFVIIAAMLFLRKKSSNSREKRLSNTTANVGKQIIFRYVIFGLIAVSLFASTGYWYWNWQDGNQVVRVTIVSPLEDKSDVYHVRKKDISNNQITTVEGINIRLSNQERVIIAAAK